MFHYIYYTSSIFSFNTIDFSRVFEMLLKKKKKREHHNLENIWTCVFAPYTKIAWCWWKGYVRTMLQYFGFIFGNVQQRLKSFAEKLAFLEQSHCNIPELFAFTPLLNDAYQSGNGVRKTLSPLRYSLALKFFYAWSLLRNWRTLVQFRKLGFIFAIASKFSSLEKCFMIILTATLYVLFLSHANIVF